MSHRCRGAAASPRDMCRVFAPPHASAVGGRLRVGRVAAREDERASLPSRPSGRSLLAPCRGQGEADRSPLRWVRRCSLVRVVEEARCVSGSSWQSDCKDVIDVDGEPYRRHRRFASGAGSALTVASAMSPHLWVPNERRVALAAGGDMLARSSSRPAGICRCRAMQRTHPAGSALMSMPAGPQTPATG